jgi:hypothetical protein
MRPEQVTQRRLFFSTGQQIFFCEEKREEKTETEKNHVSYSDKQ